MTQPPMQQYGTPGQSPGNNEGVMYLKNDELGRDAVKIMNYIFGSNKNVELDISGLEENQPISGSNPFRRFSLGPIVRELLGNDVQLISPQESEINFRLGILPDKINTYEDLALIVSSLTGPNQQLAQYLVQQAEESGTQVQYPLVFYGLETVKDDNFPDGLRFDFTDITVSYNVPILSQSKGYFDADDPELIKNGFPSKLLDIEGSPMDNRILYTPRDGLWSFSRIIHHLTVTSYLDIQPIGDSRTSFSKENPEKLEAKLEAVGAVIRHKWF